MERPLCASSTVAGVHASPMPRGVTHAGEQMTLHCYSARFRQRFRDYQCLIESALTLAVSMKRNGNGTVALSKQSFTIECCQQQFLEGRG